MKILVGYDGSDSSKEALKLARKHAVAFGATVHVVTSMEKSPEMKQEDQALSELEAAKAMFAEKNVPCETHLLIRGVTPGEDIVDFANDKKIDEIIIGIVKRSKVGKLLMGSTAQTVILGANCPVISLR